ncbi:MAG: DUF2844 domain-containing protein [Candidatus Acidiferrales bacterium]
MKSKIMRGLLIMLVLPFPLSASLGGDVASVQADQAKMQGSLRSTSNNSYTVHEIQASTGIDVKEYASPSGKVFAITWQGPSHPDLRQLLGPYFGQYEQAAQAQVAQRRGHGPVLIQLPGLVVQLAGHMRSFVGRAYVPQMLPAGVHAEDVR